MVLTGVIPANILPFDEDLGIDEAAYVAHLNALVEVDGVTGVTCNGHAAEVSSLDTAERARALEIAVDAVAGRVPVISGLFARDQREAVTQAASAAAAGADALLVFPPDFLSYTDDQTAPCRYFELLAEKVSLPLVAFMYPQFTGKSYSAEQLEAICTVDSVVAVKDWSLDIATYERNLAIARSARHRVSLLSSFSTHLLPSLAIGGDGILSGHGSVIAPLQVELLRAVDRGDLLSARSAYDRIQKLTRGVYRSPMPNMYARMKQQLVMLGAPMSARVRPPLQEVSEHERVELRRALEAAGLLARVAR
jgi:4-hydroxy-tetrahydrodipicolinate synthase